MPEGQEHGGGLLQLQEGREFSAWTGMAVASVKREDAARITVVAMEVNMVWIV